MLRISAQNIRFARGFVRTAPSELGAPKELSARYSLLNASSSEQQAARGESEAFARKASLFGATLRSFLRKRSAPRSFPSEKPRFAGLCLRHLRLRRSPFASRTKHASSARSSLRSKLTPFGSWRCEASLRKTRSAGFALGFVRAELRSAASLREAACTCWARSKVC